MQSPRTLASWVRSLSLSLSLSLSDHPPLSLTSSARLPRLPPSLPDQLTWPGLHDSQPCAAISTPLAANTVDPYCTSHAIPRRRQPSPRSIVNQPLLESQR
ncbi:hypothetical protein CORC01_07628 [Colletotrichum orchidophilum]|uniref:Secreted protein n=1 Tax=Colletotrichum orchidophilum TaxID=1209926 RepID=A0A1G4B6E3_9PEZI|nr:uncharacterized protein CORC01_07628 [Colletotrichum orchidophilum]OHE97019.1 hypothetical protein CORC01_07628 [Colletotrichum orchidophilum]